MILAAAVMCWMYYYDEVRESIQWLVGLSVDLIHMFVHCVINVFKRKSFLVTFHDGGAL
jgi:hypothetical protein